MIWVSVKKEVLGCIRKEPECHWTFFIFIGKVGEKDTTNIQSSIWTKLHHMQINAFDTGNE